MYLKHLKILKIYNTKTKFWFEFYLLSFFIEKTIKNRNKSERKKTKKNTFVFITG